MYIFPYSRHMKNINSFWQAYQLMSDWDLLFEPCVFCLYFLRHYVWINDWLWFKHNLVFVIFTVFPLLRACETVWLMLHHVFVSYITRLGCGCHIAAYWWLSALHMIDHCVCTPYSGNQEDCSPHQWLSQTTTTACNYDFSDGELCTLCGLCVNRRKQSTCFEGNILLTIHISNVYFYFHDKINQLRLGSDTKPMKYKTEI